MAPNLTIGNQRDRTPESAAPTRTPSGRIIYTGSFGANEAETQVDQIDVSPYRSIVLACRSSAWSSVTVTIKIYAADSLGNRSTNPIITKTITANANTLDVISEMGGSTTNAVWPTASVTAGQVIEPFGNTIVITETAASFVSGTNTLSVELLMKG
jgi:hypothetical protein